MSKDKQQPTTEELLGFFTPAETVLATEQPAALVASDATAPSAEPIEIVDGMPRTTCKACGNEYYERSLIDGYCLLCYDARKNGAAPAKTETPPVPPLRRLAERYVEMKAAAAAAKEALRAVQEQQAKDNATLVEASKKAAEEAEAAKAELQSAAEEQYWLTSEKHPLPGVNVKVTTSLEYDEEAALEWARRNALALLRLDSMAIAQSVAAWEWAKANAPDLLILNLKAFEDFAWKQKLGFVTITEEPLVTIAPDLEAKLRTGGAE